MESVSPCQGSFIKNECLFPEDNPAMNSKVRFNLLLVLGF